MSNNKDLKSASSIQTPFIHQNLITSSTSIYSDLLGGGKDGSKPLRDQFTPLLKFEQGIGCFHYFLLIFLNIFYVGWQGGAFFGVVITLSPEAYIPAALIIVLMVMPTKIFWLASVYVQVVIIGSAKIFSLLIIKKLQNNDTNITLSLMTTHYQDEQLYFTHEKPVCIELKSDDRFTEDNELAFLLDRHKFILLEFQIDYQFNNFDDEEKISKLFHQYKKENKIQIRGKTKIHVNPELLGLETLSCCYYTEKPQLKMIKLWAYFFIIIGLWIPFIIVARCNIKRHKVKIIKHVKSASIK